MRISRYTTLYATQKPDQKTSEMGPLFISTALTCFVIISITNVADMEESSQPNFLCVIQPDELPSRSPSRKLDHESVRAALAESGGNKAEGSAKNNLAFLHPDFTISLTDLQSQKSSK